MRVVLNGEPCDLREGLSVADLIADLGLNQRRIAVEVNREIIVRERYAHLLLVENDEVEIVHFVGGG
jgi:thiamine biosynthesis protein ThiS